MHRPGWVALWLAVCALEAGVAGAADGPVVVIPGKAGVPVIINEFGHDASYTIVEGEWGLGRPGVITPRIVSGTLVIPVLPPYRPYYPGLRHRAGLWPPRGRAAGQSQAAETGPQFQTVLDLAVRTIAREPRAAGATAGDRGGAGTRDPEATHPEWSLTRGPAGSRRRQPPIWIHTSIDAIIGDIIMILRLVISLMLLGSALSAVGPAEAADLSSCYYRPCRVPHMAIKRLRAGPVEPFYIVDQGPTYAGPNIRTLPSFEVDGGRMDYPYVGRHLDGGWHWQPPSSVYLHPPRGSLVPADIDD